MAAVAATMAMEGSEARYFQLSDVDLPVRIKMCARTHARTHARYHRHCRVVLAADRGVRVCAARRRVALNRLTS